jgi:hypothetical protein
MNSPGSAQKYKKLLAVFLILVVCVLVAANLIKYRSAAKLIVLQNKDVIDALAKLIGALALVTGAIASYYRFFRGRTFAARAELNLDVAVYDTDEDFRLHVINLEVSNVGPIPILEPEPTIDVYLYGPKRTEKYAITKWWQPTDDDQPSVPTIALIDTQESSQFHSSQHIGLEVWAVLYVAKVVSSRGDTWMRAITVSNKEGSLTKA